MNRQPLIGRGLAALFVGAWGSETTRNGESYPLQELLRESALLICITSRHTPYSMELCEMAPTKDSADWAPSDSLYYSKGRRIAARHAHHMVAQGSLNAELIKVLGASFLNSNPSADLDQNRRRLALCNLAWFGARGYSPNALLSLLANKHLSRRQAATGTGLSDCQTGDSDSTTSVVRAHPWTIDGRFY